MQDGATTSQDEGGDRDGDDLLRRAQEGEAGAFEALVEREQDRVFGLAFRMTRSEADAAEIAQDTFLSAYQHLKDFRGQAAFGSWVHRIAAHNALMRLRHLRVVDKAAEDPTAPALNRMGFLRRPPQQWERPADGQALDAELGNAIQQAADLLPDGHREVFLLKDVEGLSYGQIAEITGDSVAAIKSRLHRARLSL